MQTWSVEVRAGGRSLTETKIQRGIFQGDTLSRLISIIAMMPLTQKMRCGIQTQQITREDQSPNVHG